MSPLCNQLHFACHIQVYYYHIYSACWQIVTSFWDVTMINMTGKVVLVYASLVLYQCRTVTHAVLYMCRGLHIYLYLGCHHLFPITYITTLSSSLSAYLPMALLGFYAYCYARKTNQCLTGCWTQSSLYFYKQHIPIL